ncbi:methyltransferase [Candidatus Micrarchaeota archaeon]|nr:methyltransferase [Candidatus Micrarchaeota archaeon]
MRKKDIFVRLNPMLKKMKRGPFGGPQVVLPKDFGVIIAYTGIGKKSVVVEAGGGAGFLTISLANVCKRVHAYEKRKDYYDNIKKNIEKSGLKNIRLKNKDISKGIKEKDVDAVILDMPESDKIIPLAYDSLKEGGWVIGYLPNVEQMKDFYLECERCGFDGLFAIETITREWVVREKGVRPQHKGLIHTAFIVFARKL